jgi:hypothetical protein
MVTRWSGYLTQAFDCSLVKVLHCYSIRWERCATASQDHLALTGELAWRQHSWPWLHCRRNLRSPSGTLGTGVATWVTMRVVVTTPLTVTPILATELEPPPLPGTLTGTLLWSSTSVMGLTRLSAQCRGSDDSSDRWMTLQPCKQKCKYPSAHRVAWHTTSSVTLGLTLMLKSCKDLSLGRCWVPSYASLVSFRSQLFKLSHHFSCPLVVSLPLPWLLVHIASIS